MPNLKILNLVFSADIYRKSFGWWKPTYNPISGSSCRSWKQPNLSVLRMTLYMTVEVYFWAKHWLIFYTGSLKNLFGYFSQWEIFKAIIPKHLYELSFNFCSTRKKMKLQKNTRFTQCHKISKGQRGDQVQEQNL